MEFILKPLFAGAFFVLVICMLLVQKDLCLIELNACSCLNYCCFSVNMQSDLLQKIDEKHVAVQFINV